MQPKQHLPMLTKCQADQRCCLFSHHTFVQCFSPTSSQRLSPSVYLLCGYPFIICIYLGHNRNTVHQLSSLRFHSRSFRWTWTLRGTHWHSPSHPRSYSNMLSVALSDNRAAHRDSQSLPTVHVALAICGCGFSTIKCRCEKFVDWGSLLGDVGLTLGHLGTVVNVLLHLG
jgi:hypothetical protein